MQFGLFFEHQLPRPWREGDEQRLFQDGLVQAELADRLGIDFLWAVEHHFLEEYSESSAPEVFLAACSQRTKNIRLGHGVVLMPAAYNHPARVAERIATLDLISGGRVEWGTGEGTTFVELDAFHVNPAEKGAMWAEAVREAAKMLCQTPYPGFAGRYFALPSRNIVPKPLQKPHPPLWTAGGRDTIRTAARLGIGALTFAFADQNDAKHWVDEYYSTFKTACEPIGRIVNPNIAMVMGLMCHEASDIARSRGLEGFDYFTYALSHYGYGPSHVPGRSNLWDAFKHSGTWLRFLAGGIGSPDEVRANLEKLEEAGVDQVIFMHQSGHIRHEHICESLELFATKVLPDFKERHEARARQKARELAPYIELANLRIPHLSELESVPPVRSGSPALTKKLGNRSVTRASTNES